jgi:transposase-like protein
LLKEQVESGKSVRQFCKELGIRENQFFWWRKKLNSEKPAKEQIAPKLASEKSFDFLPVTVVDSKAKETLDDNAGRMERIDIFLPNGSMVRISGCFSTEQMVKAISLAAGETC